MDAISFGIKPDFFWSDDNKFLYRVIYENYSKNSSLLTRSGMGSIMDMQATYTDAQRSARKMHWSKIYGMSSEAPLEDYILLRDAINGRYTQQQLFSLFFHVSG